MALSMTEEPGQYDLYETTMLDYYETDNQTCPSSVLPFSYIYLPILYYIVFFSGVVGNLFVVLVICRKRKSSRLVDTFVINLALADLVFVFTLPLWAFSAWQDQRWPFGEALCKLSSYIIAVNRFSNIFFLTCMSIDRYLAVVRLMESRYLRSAGCIRGTCLAVWGVSFVLGAPSLVYRYTARTDGENDSCMEDLESGMSQALSVATLLLTFLLPLLIILFCYCSILVKLRHLTDLGNGRTEAQRRHSVKMVFTIIAAFIISWLPFIFFRAILVGSKFQKVELSCQLQDFMVRGLILSSCLAFLNSCINPVIYVLLDHHFRRQARGLWHACRSSTKVHSSSGSTFTSFSDSFFALSRFSSNNNKN